MVMQKVVTVDYVPAKPPLHECISLEEIVKRGYNKDLPKNEDASITYRKYPNHLAKSDAYLEDIGNSVTNVQRCCVPHGMELMSKDPAVIQALKTATAYLKAPDDKSAAGRAKDIKFFGTPTSPNDSSHHTNNIQMVKWTKARAHKLKRKLRFSEGYIVMIALCYSYQTSTTLPPERIKDIEREIDLFRELLKE